MACMKFVVKKSKIPQWGYEITGRNFHNIAPTEEAAINYLKGRFGADVRYTVKAEKGEKRK